MTPCTRDSTTWDLAQICDTCNHHGLAHPGPNQITTCILCDLNTTRHNLNQRIDDLDKLLEVIRQHEAAWNRANEEIEERLTDVRRQMDGPRSRALRDLNAPLPRPAASPPGGWHPTTHQPIGMTTP